MTIYRLRFRLGRTCEVEREGVDLSKAFVGYGSGIAVHGVSPLDLGAMARAVFPTSGRAGLDSAAFCLLFAPLDG